MEERQHRWGTQAIISAPIRETEDMVIAEPNGLHFKENKHTGQVWLNGYPFQSAAQMLSAVSRLAAIVELRARRSKQAERRPDR